MALTRAGRRTGGSLPAEPAEIVLVELEATPPGADPNGGTGWIDRALSVAGLEVRYRRRLAVSDVDLHVERGEVVALVGHNGCGKSSTLRAIVGLVPASRGDVRVAGRAGPAPGGRGRRAEIGFVPADGEVFDDLTVRENLLLGAWREPDPQVVVGRVDEAFARFPGLLGRQRIAAGRLSGGERRLLGLAVALMTRPRVLLLDEPTRHLAPAVAGSVLDLVRSLAIDDGVAVLMAEVNVAAALAVADRAYVMRSGTILASHDAAALRAAGPTAWWDMF
jgi:branched-chain amino acid transport system ATP-binding protein